MVTWYSAAPAADANITVANRGIIAFMAVDFSSCLYIFKLFSGKNALGVGFLLDGFGILQKRLTAVYIIVKLSYK